MKAIVFALFLAAGCYVNPLDGAACEEDEDCNSGFCLRQWENGKEVPGGICTHACPEDTCEKDAYQICVRYSQTNEGFCFMRCEDDSWCREDWYCGPETQACLPRPTP